MCKFEIYVYFVSVHSIQIIGIWQQANRQTHASSVGLAQSHPNSTLVVGYHAQSKRERENMRSSSQSDEDLHHQNTSKIFNFVCTAVYYTLVVCYHAQSKREKGNKKRREGS